ncbi:unnamed protein product [Linum trigynum]|uniref:Uncharacterized protein n=1 Tax=Linum trigynum TaxID=586398 RepID=A0AAV2GWF0_9ROSI
MANDEETISEPAADHDASTNINGIAAAGREEGAEEIAVAVPDDDGNNGNRRFSKREIVGEMKKQAGLAGPLVSFNFLTYLLQVISVMFVGHLGPSPALPSPLLSLPSPA